VSRIDNIGQNGNDGLHYRVEKVARILARTLHNPDKNVSYTHYLEIALEIVEELDG